MKHGEREANNSSNGYAPPGKSRLLRSLHCNSLFCLVIEKKIKEIIENNKNDQLPCYVPQEYWLLGEIENE